MIVKVTTLTGSVYRVDYDAKTWERTEATPWSGPTVTERGVFAEVGLAGEGYPLYIWYPLMDPRFPGREIITSTVIKVEQVE